MSNDPISEHRNGESSTDAQNPAKDRRRWPRESAPTLGSNVAPPALTPVRFSTRELTPSDQFAAWAGYLAPLVDVRLPDNVSSEAVFHADHVVWNLGRMLLVQQHVQAHSYERSLAKLRANPIDHWCIAIPRSGSAWTEVDGRVAESGVGRVDITCLGHPFRGRTTESDTLFIYLPRDLFGDVTSLLDASNNIAVSGNLAEVLVEYTSSIEQRLSTLTEEELPSVVQTTREMIVACLMPSASRAEVTGKQASLALMERARQHIHDNLASEHLTPQSLSRALGISRTQLYLLFEPSGGVARYIQKRRLLAAHAALSDPEQNSRIVEIAEEVGFSSAADFSRAFSREFGYSPREARNRIATAGLLHSSQTPGRQEHDTFIAWLKALGS